MTTIQPSNPSLVDEIENTSILLWYDKRQDIMKRAEVMPGTYVTDFKPADATSGSLKEGERGSVKLSVHKDGMISLDNSCIYMETKLDITIPDQTNSYIKEYYLGFRDVASIIRDYAIWSNSDSVQTRTNADYEWFLKNITKLTAATKNNDSDALLEKIRQRKSDVPGIYIPVDGITKDTICNALLNLKIPVTKFLILEGMKWLADWMGTWTIEMWLSMRSIVIAPVIPEALFTIYPKIQEAMDDENNGIKASIEPDLLFNFGFHHINQPMHNRFKLNEATGDVEILKAHTWKCDDHLTRITGIDLTTYTLKSHVAATLREEYLDRPLLLPLTIVEYKNFDRRLSDEDNPKPMTDPSLQFTDSGYIVFKKDSGVKQCFINPFCRYQLNINGGMYPQKPLKTVNELRNKNQLLDAFNLNNSLLGCITDDLASSLQPFIKMNKYDPTTSKWKTTFKWTTGDHSAFIIGYPFCDSGIFQGGISSKEVIELNLERLKESEVPKKCTSVKFDVPVFVSTQERILAIYSARPGDGSQVRVLVNTFDELIPPS